jgi:catechol 2,3-dioxygenase-like lactoylglutathione lyase family enzyme
MTVVLNHTIVPVADKHRGARLFADFIGVGTTMESGPFAAVRVNDDLTFDFDDRLGSRPGHYAFLVDDGTFDHALATAKAARLKWGSAPRLTDYEINHHAGGRGVYIRDPDGIAYEFFTAVP